MKNKKSCPKCNSKNISIITGLPIKLPKKTLTATNPKYYICTECGYCEIWFDKEKDLQYLKEIEQF